MKCSIHPTADATAVCIHCGRALCPGCITKSASGRVVCSEACSKALLQTEQVIHNLRARSVRGARVVGYLSIAIAAVFCGFGAFEFYSGIARLGWFLVPVSAVLAASGVAFLRIARKQEIV